MLRFKMLFQVVFLMLSAINIGFIISSFSLKANPFEYFYIDTFPDKNIIKKVTRTHKEYFR